MHFDEGTRQTAFYLEEAKMVEVHRFDSDWKRWSRISHVNIDQYSKLSKFGLRKLLLVPNSQILCMLDNNNECYFFEIQTKSIQPRTLMLGGPYQQALVTSDGTCLLTFSAAYQDTAETETECKNFCDENICPNSAPDQKPDPGTFHKSRMEKVQMNVFLLHTKKKLKTIDLPSHFTPEMIETCRVIVLSGETYLVANDMNGFWAQKIKITTEKSVFDCSAFDSEHKPGVSTKNDNDNGILGQKIFLDYLYHIFDKYPVNDSMRPTKKMINITCAFPVDEETFESQFENGEVFQRYLKQLAMELEYATRKDCIDLFNKINATCSKNLKDLLDEPLDISNVNLLDWTENLICLIPIQIARAENNSLTVQSQNEYAVDAGTVIAIAQDIDFGMYERIIHRWRGAVKVVSSMGKQSTGKSYMLNHLSGSHFDIAGTRCTEGVWMTVRKGVDCLYVILDFEGLGSIERSDQEDMLMSVFNAAISGLTLYKTEFRIDADTINMWSKFRDGVNLIKGDDRLLNGWFYIIIKDVDLRDVDDLEAEFMQKLTKICQDDENNFLNRMYAGQLCISTFPFLGRPEFYDELKNMKDHIMSEKCFSYGSGNEFLNVMKILLAKIQIQDWQSFDRTAITLELGRLRHHMQHAINLGRLSEDEEDILTDENGLEIEDTVDEEWFPKDAGLLLGEESGSSNLLFKSNILDLYKEQTNDSSDTMNPGEWFTGLQDFLHAVCQRRATRINSWVNSNTKRFQEDPDTNMLKDQILSMLTKQKNDWTLCGDNCTECFQKCLKTRYHLGQCSCFTDHQCSKSCEFCYNTEMSRSGEDQTSKIIEKCQEPAGHEGKHNCKRPDHTCGKECNLSNKLQCGKYCTKEPGHEAEGDNEHMCSAKHLCGEACALPSCDKICCLPVDVVHGGSGQEPHQCQDLACPEDCQMAGCNRKCHCTNNHFHALQIEVPLMDKEKTEHNESSSPEEKDEQPETTTINLATLPEDELKALLTDRKILANNVGKEIINKICKETLLASIEKALKEEKKVKHFCDFPHQCSHDCEELGICDIQSECIVEEKEYTTAFNQIIKYDKKTEQNGRRRKCCIQIPPFLEEHEGSHVHTVDPNRQHFCDVRCPSCGYFCTQPYGHNGLHNTDHGNMRLAKFVSATDSFAVEDRIYGVGDIGEAEMCNMYCRSLGRGHLHISYCQTDAAHCTASREDGVQHALTRYNPDPDQEKDELTHGAYWDSIRFTDPCAPNEIEEFKKCAARCSHPDHEEEGTPSFCCGNLWHEDFSQAGLPEDLQNIAGRVSNDGHIFECQHSTNLPVHTIFIIDRSGSMNSSEWVPQMSNFQQNHLGCVFEACHCFVTQRVATGSDDRMSMIAFDDMVSVVCENQKIATEHIQQANTTVRPRGWTSFSPALKAAFELLTRTEQSSQANNGQPYQAVMIFLSDGLAHDHDICSSTLKMLLEKRWQAGKPGIRFHTVSFGTLHDPVLENLAETARDFEHNDDFAYQSSFESSIDGIGLAEAFVNIASSLQAPKGGLVV